MQDYKRTTYSRTRKQVLVWDEACTVDLFLFQNHMLETRQASVVRTLASQSHTSEKRLSLTSLLTHRYSNDRKNFLTEHIRTVNPTQKHSAQEQSGHIGTGYD